MKKISCKPYLINRLVFVLLLGGTMVFVPILLYFFDTDTLDVLTNIVMLNTVFTVFMFYLTRNEVYTLIIDGEMLHLDFFNKSIFKRKELVLERSDLTAQANDSMIELFYENKHIANIRKVSMKTDEWEVISQFLKNNNEK
jgi:hypothetical protein